MKKVLMTALIALAMPFSVLAADAVPEVTQQQVIAYANVNVDDAERLATLMKGVGPAIAERIVQYRSEHGSFNSVEDLLLVKGIGPKTLQKNLHLLKI